MEKYTLTVYGALNTSSVISYTLSGIMEEFEILDRLANKEARIEVTDKDGNVICSRG